MEGLKFEVPVVLFVGSIGNIVNIVVVLELMRGSRMWKMRLKNL